MNEEETQKGRTLIKLARYESKEKSYDCIEYKESKVEEPDF